MRRDPAVACGATSLRMHFLLALLGLVPKAAYI